MSNSESKMVHLDLMETDEIALFDKAVSDSIKQPGIVDIINPQYEYHSGEKSITFDSEEYGIIMNVERYSHGIFPSESSVVEINKFV